MELDRKTQTEKVKDERKRLMELIRYRGNYRNNLKVLEQKEGNFIVRRAPSKSMGLLPSMYIPCPRCLAFLVKEGELHVFAMINSFEQA